MSDTQMNYMAKFSLDTSDLSKGITGAAISFDAVMIAGKEAFAMIKEGYDMTIEKAIQYGEAIHTLADITGDSEENMQRLRGAAVATGTSFDSVSQTIRIFSQRIGDTGKSGDALREKLAAIGIQVKDNNGNYREAADLYMEINKKLGDVTNTFERNNLASDIYGKSWYNITDMITKADVAAKAFKQTEVLSDADIAKAKDFGIQLGVISDRLNMMEVKVGSNILDSIGQNALLTGNWRDTGIGKLLGLDNEGAIKAGADRDPNQSLKEHTKAIEPLIDKYKGMTLLQVEYTTTQADMIKAQAKLDYELKHGTQESVDAASLELVNLKAKYEDVRLEMAKVAKQAMKTHSIIKNPYAGNDDPNSMIGMSAENVRIYRETEASFAGIQSDDYAPTSTNLLNNQVANIWKYADQNADSSYESSDFLAQIRTIATEARGVNVNGYDWTHTNENTRFTTQTMDLWNTYQAQKSGQAGITQINYIQGTNAQDVANQIAEATSRALARQVTS